MDILIDTCVWVDLLRKGDGLLAELLIENLVCTHPLVIGELATGNLPRRTEVLEDLQALKRVPEAEFTEVLHLVETRQLHGRGLQWNDCSLLASALIARTPLWTRDRRLAEAAQECGCRWVS